MAQFELKTPQVKLLFDKNSSGFQFQVKKNGSWQPVTRPQNPLLFGPSFNLYPQEIKKTSPKKLLLSGQQAAPSLKNQKFSYSWQGLITLLENNWFKFELELHLPQPLQLQPKTTPAPQIGFQLPPISVQEEGGGIWNQVLLQNPVTDSQGIQSTDLPAAYFFDPQTSTEMAIYLDWESFNWSSHDNIFGFLGGCCGLKSTLKKDQQTPIRERFFGFWPENQEYLGAHFPKGKNRFVFYFHLQPLDHQPDEWEALSKLIQGLTPFLKSRPFPPQTSYSWETFSQKCLQELISQKKATQIKFPQGLGLKAYAHLKDFHCPNPATRAELMTQVDLIWPLLLLNQINPHPEREKFLQNLQKLLPHFYDSQSNFFANWYPLEKNLLHQDQETWYFLENGLVKFGWIALLTQDSQLKKIFLRFTQGLIKLAEENSYLFPLKYDWRRKENVGSRKNFIAAGLFSYGLCLAFQVKKEKAYLQKAQKALNTLHQLPLDFLFHEPQQLGFAAAAAQFLSQASPNPTWEQLTQAFLSQQLRMFYWYSDPTLLKTLNCDSAGMVRSFPSKIYPVVKQNPAFKENVESLVPWITLLKEKNPLLPLLLKFLNLARLNNFYFFDLYQKNPDPSFIPLEALPALPQSGSRHQGGGVGRAIYGAGEVLWLYLLFEALAQPSDPQILAINLDYLHFQPSKKFLKEQNFLVFNPTSQKRQFKLRFLKPPGQEKNRPLTLKPQEYQYVKIS